MSVSRASTREFGLLTTLPVNMSSGLSCKFAVCPALESFPPAALFSH